MRGARGGLIRVKTALVTLVPAGVKSAIDLDPVEDRMRRRDLLAAIIAATTAQPGRAQDPNRVYRIGYLGINPPTRTVAEVWKAFDEGLREHGLIEGQNVLIERRFSEGREERQPGFVAELLAWKADVIV